MDDVVVDEGPLWSGDGRTWERARSLLVGTRTADGPSVSRCLHQLCLVASSGLEATGAGAVLRSRYGGEATAAASDDPTRARVELEFDVGEGPAGDAYWLGRPVLVPEVDGPTSTRWPGWTTLAREAGIGAVFCFPLQLGASRFGVMTVVDDEPRHLRTEQVSHALAVAEVATTILLLGAEEGEDGGTVDPGLVSDLGFRSEVFQAQGMLAVALELSLPSALARLRALAFASGRDLTDVAVAILEGRLDLTDDLEGP